MSTTREGQLPASLEASVGIHLNGRVAVLTAGGEFDLSTAALLSSALERACDHSNNVTLDLSGCTFFDVYNLRWIVRARDRLDREGGRLRVVNAGEATRRLLEMTELAELLED